VVSTKKMLAAAPPQPTVFNTIGVIAVAFGVGVLGAYMLGLHSHTCVECGHRWRHLGAFNLGDLEAHTCGRCGTVQWWKSGWQSFDGKDGAFVTATPNRPMQLAAAQLRAPTLRSENNP
jgi:hypothetical protein